MLALAGFVPIIPIITVNRLNSLDIFVSHFLKRLSAEYLES